MSYGVKFFFKCLFIFSLILLLVVNHNRNNKGVIVYSDSNKMMNSLIELKALQKNIDKLEKTLQVANEKKGTFERAKYKLQELVREFIYKKEILEYEINIIQLDVNKSLHTKTTFVENKFKIEMELNTTDNAKQKLETKHKTEMKEKLKEIDKEIKKNDDNFLKASEQILKKYKELEFNQRRIAILNKKIYERESGIVLKNDEIRQIKTKLQILTKQKDDDVMVILNNLVVSENLKNDDYDK